MYLIDFGLAKRYRDVETGQHVIDKKDVDQPGNLSFCSVNQIRGHTPSRRDDIIQVIQTMIFMRDWKQEWVTGGSNHRGRSQRQRIRNFKLRSTPEEMCGGPKTAMLAPLLKEAYSYRYDDEPRYDFFKRELIRIL